MIHNVWSMLEILLLFSPQSFLIIIIATAFKISDKRAWSIGHGIFRIVHMTRCNISMNCIIVIYWRSLRKKKSDPTMSSEFDKKAHNNNEQHKNYYHYLRVKHYSFIKYTISYKCTITTRYTIHVQRSSSQSLIQF